MKNEEKAKEKCRKKDRKVKRKRKWKRKRKMGGRVNARFIVVILISSSIRRWPSPFDVVQHRLIFCLVWIPGWLCSCGKYEKKKNNKTKTTKRPPLKNRQQQKQPKKKNKWRNAKVFLVMVFQKPNVSKGIFALR